MKVLKLALIILIAISCSTFSQEEIDKMPTIKGGIQALAKNIKYPETAKKDGIMGTVFVKALIDETEMLKTLKLKKE